MGAKGPQRTAQQRQGQTEQLRSHDGGRHQRKRSENRDTHPERPPAGEKCGGSPGCEKSIRGQAADRRAELYTSAGRHCRRDRTERGRENHPFPHDHREEQPDEGEIKIGETVMIGYVDQRHADLDPEKTVFEVISGGHEDIEISGQRINARAYVSRFNFSGPDQQKKIGVLSGGERNRLHLAMTLKTEANVLLLDEPTNDIDVNTLRALEEGIENFAGCAVVISHDRWFLDRICTHILAFEGDSKVYWFEGSYSEYEENRKKRLGDEGPKRVKFRNLVKED